MRQVIWHGSEAEGFELRAILTKNCTCAMQSNGKKKLCAGHHAMVYDQMFMDSLIDNRQRRISLLTQEMRTEP